MSATQVFLSDFDYARRSTPQSADEGWLVLEGGSHFQAFVRVDPLPADGFGGQVWIMEGSTVSPDGTVIMKPPPLSGYLTADSRVVFGTGILGSRGSAFEQSSLPLRFATELDRPEDKDYACSCDLHLTVSLRLNPADHPQCVLERTWHNLRSSFGPFVDEARHPGRADPCVRVSVPVGAGQRDADPVCSAWIVPTPQPPPPPPIDTASP